MDNERFDWDQENWDDGPFIEDLSSWDEGPFIEDMTAEYGAPPTQEPDEPDDDFPWFNSQREPPRSGGGASPWRPSSQPPRSGGQRPRGQPPKKRRRRRRRSRVKTVLLVLLLVVLCALAAGAAYFHHVMGKINFVPGDAEASQGENIKKMDKLTNILLVGEDSRTEGETGQRSDSMILCTLNPDTHEVILTSFMRDMYVPIPGYKDNRINSAFSRGGVELLEKTIQVDFGVRVDGYVSIDFGGFIEAVASLGNMQMELTEEEADYMNAHPEYGWADIGETWDLQPGWNTLTPNQFLCYARMRHLGNSDFDRTERQRKVLMTCYQQVKNCSVPQLLSLIDSVAPYITTDIRGTDLLSYAYMLAGDGVNNIESNRLPAEGTYQMKNINGMEVLVPDLEQNKAILQEYINNTRSNQDEAEAGDGDDHMGVVQGHMAVAESNPVENE